MQNKISLLFQKILADYNHLIYENGGNPNRYSQLLPLQKALNNFPFERVVAIETGASSSWKDGMSGWPIAKLANLTSGNFYSVDNNLLTSEKSKQMYKNLEVDTICTVDDSVNFLKGFDNEVPNLVFLDSWDVDLKDPLPCALHCWREFEAIESKMPIGSIIVIDDNWYKGMWVEWFIIENMSGQIISSEKINIDYPILGKGAHVYQWVLPGDKHWKLIDASYKIVIQKIK